MLSPRLGDFTLDQSRYLLQRGDSVLSLGEEADGVVACAGRAAREFVTRDEIKSM